MTTQDSILLRSTILTFVVFLLLLAFSVLQA